RSPPPAPWCRACQARTRGWPVRRPGTGAGTRSWPIRRPAARPPAPRTAPAPPPARAGRGRARDLGGWGAQPLGPRLRERLQQPPEPVRLGPGVVVDEGHERGGDLAQGDVVAPGEPVVA